jgi:tetratricopeptide (TPR) repeat protein
MQIVQHRLAPIEQKQRLSRSVLWKLQRDYYTRAGIDAWRRDGLPYLITTNPYLADVYARIVLAFLRDSASEPEDSTAAPPPPLDRSRPIHIIELGAGHGGFGHFFLKKFLPLHSGSRLKDCPIKYVMTDFAEANLAFLESHASLRPFFESGLLDLARFDVEHDQQLQLINSGEVLSPDTVANPVVIIANYIFDSIPQDAFHVEGGQLYEDLVTVSSRQKEVSLDDPEVLSRLHVSYQENRINGDYYLDAEWNRMLLEYGNRLPGTPFLFPTAALQCIQNLHRLSGGRLLLLSADKGYSHDEELLLGHGRPEIVGHAKYCFSMMVDYHLIGEYFCRRGGEALRQRQAPAALNICAFLLGNPPAGYLETREAYEKLIEDFSPDDLFTIEKSLDTILDRLSVDQIIAFLKLSAWSHRVFYSCLPVLKERLTDISDAEKRKLCQAIMQMWDAYFHIGDENDLPFHCGTLLLEMDFYSEALLFLQRSVDLYGQEPGTLYNMTVCYYRLRLMDQALECINLALELDPEFDVAKAMRITLKSELNRPLHLDSGVEIATNSGLS